ncbi:MAG TPA: hypothetical protein VNN80_36190, partial [Polyangiaceae bacterium]|nr:hypothetical protein [Polyangiaceae bacterium]
MTTSSGKPPIDEQGHNARWVPASDSAPAQPDGDAAEPPTQRQRAHSSDAAAEDEEGPAYGALVPYGGDDRTEEIDPVALDAPFTLEQQKTPPAPAAHAQTPRAPAFVPREARDDELKAPVTQLVLSDLFDSVPSSAALAPPDPAAFTSSRPPAPERAPERAPAAAVPAVVALPSIDIGAAAPPARSPSRPPQHTPAPADDEPRRRMPTLESLGTGRSSSEAREPSPKPPLSLGSSPAPGRSSPTASPPRGSSPAASPARASSPAVSPAWGSSPAASPARASSPAASPRASSPAASPRASSPAASPARASSPTASPARASSPPASPSQPSSPSAAASSPAAAPEPAAPATAAPAGPSPAAPAELDAVARFPSDVATSRPPDVMPIPAAAGFGPSRERAPLATVAAPITVQGARAQEQLPSIMLAADVEAEPDSSARRALRAARATVRIELPASFARPGSPLQPNAPSAPVAYAPPPSYPPAAAYAGPEVVDGALLGQARTRRLL